MSIAPGQAISMIKGTSGRRESISVALLAGKMKPMSFNSNAIIEEDEEEAEEDKKDKIVEIPSSRKASSASVRLKINNNSLISKKLYVVTC